MKKLLIQLGFVFSCAILFSGCSNEGSLPAEAEKDAFFDPLPQGLPVFTEIDEAFIADSLNDSSKSALFTYQLPENPQDSSQIKEIFASDERLILTLNTVDDPDFKGRSEVTILVRNDSIYAINHLNDQIRLLTHFTNTVCELIPREKVVNSDSQGAGSLTVLHDELIYVMTSESTGFNACEGQGKKRFYALPLDHQLDPTQTEDGKLSTLELVNESLARSRLLFGWVADAQTGVQKLVHGYLGYGLEEIYSPTLQPALVLYNAQREQVWRQDRTIEAFPLAQLTPEKKNKAYLFHVEELENQHYLIQLGLDVFLVDAGADLLSKDFNQSEDILSDRILRLTPQVFESSSGLLEYAVPARTLFDEEDLLIVDGSKIFHTTYPTAPPERTLMLTPQNPTDIASRSFADQRFFSQFDLKSCADDDAACLAAHDVEAQSWQFITPCDESLGCSLNDQVGDFCETAAEKNVSSSDEPLCVASDYRHLSELNTPANDMVFRGYMQYVDDYARKVDFILENKRLYIMAGMQQKDLLLRFNYALDFSAPKSQREQVLFGKYSDVFGLDAHFVNHNLFMTALTKGAVRSNECYKNYRKVACDLGELQETGNEVCTGKDLAEGLCTNQFQEFESRALFCAQSQLMDGSCSDENPQQIQNLSVESTDEDAKWLKLVDYSNINSSGYQMQLLLGNHQQALLSQQLDEGRLLNPQLFSVDVDTGQTADLLGAVNGTVEQAVHGWVVKQIQPNTVEVLAHLQLISEEIISEGLQNTQSELVNYLIEHSYADPNAEAPSPVLKKLAVSRFDRP